MNLRVLDDQRREAWTQNFEAFSSDRVPRCELVTRWQTCLCLKKMRPLDQIYGPDSKTRVIRFCVVPRSLVDL